MSMSASEKESLGLEPPTYLEELETALEDQGNRLRESGEGWTVVETDDVYDVDSGNVHDGKLRVVGDMSYAGKEFYIQPDYAEGLIRVDVNDQTRTAYMKSDVFAGADPLYWEIEDVLDEYGIDMDDRGL